MHSKCKLIPIWDLSAYFKVSECHKYVQIKLNVIIKICNDIYAHEIPQFLHGLINEAMNEIITKFYQYPFSPVAFLFLCEIDN